jgi:hypothetical protein
MRAAMACLPHEFSKLIATAVVNDQSFAEVLERRLKRIEEAKIIEAKPTPTNGTPTNGSDARPLPRLADRRFRRM